MDYNNTFFWKVNPSALDNKIAIDDMIILASVSESVIISGSEQLDTFCLFCAGGKTWTGDGDCDGDIDDFSFLKQA